MFPSALARRGMVVAPHRLAAEAGLAVLRDGGNAIEAMVAAAAAIAVVYPHMNSLGGDGFWLIGLPDGREIGIDASGPAAAAATPERYRALGLSAIPSRGPLAANTVAGAVGGWSEALELARSLGGRLPLGRLLADAVCWARDGVPATGSQVRFTEDKRAELEPVPGFADTFLPGGSPPRRGETFAQPRLAATLERLVEGGLDDFYRGDLARSLARDLEALGSPLALGDLESWRARRVEPLGLEVTGARLANLPPPTQGAASLLILAIVDRLWHGAGAPATVPPPAPPPPGPDEWGGGHRQGLALDPGGYWHVHSVVEATKAAFERRDRLIGDPDAMTVPPRALLDEAFIDRAARDIDPWHARPWPPSGAGGDTVWLGALDARGVAVSYIQSIYWEFGSGLVLPETGIVWQNRGSSFLLSGDPRHPRALAPGRRPFHTLNPALARFPDGRTMVYGTMGGEGQPQTQAAVFTRYAWLGEDLQQAVNAPRWLLGRTWGEESTSLRLEGGIDPDVVARLRAAGHPVELAPAWDSLFGHAGALVRHRAGTLEGAFDPRSDGAVACF